MKLPDKIRAWLEYFGGSRETPPREISQLAGSLVLGLWWAFLVCLIAIFCGQSSKFIYIDF